MTILAKGKETKPKNSTDYFRCASCGRWFKATTINSIKYAVRNHHFRMN